MSDHAATEDDSGERVSDEFQRVHEALERFSFFITADRQKRAEAQKWRAAIEMELSKLRGLFDTQDARLRDLETSQDDFFEEYESGGILDPFR